MLGPALLVAGEAAEVGGVVVGGGVHDERPLWARAVFRERDGGGHLFQVVSRPFAQDLAEPVEALVPDGGDEVEGGGVGARLFAVGAARQHDEASAVPAV